MFPHSIFKPKHIQLSIILATTLFSQVISATQLGSQWSDISQGSTVIISLDPALPRRGESFNVQISGTWRNSCIEWFDNLDFDLREQGIKISKPLSIPTIIDCGNEYEPTPFSRSVLIPGSAWGYIDEKKPLNVQLTLYRGWLEPHDWFREFDLNWGLHEIPPQIGQGHWVSDQRPFQGINVEQQSDTVILYELTYRRGDGEPVWKMGDAIFHGNSTHGVAYHVRWLNPTSEYDGILRDYVQPKADEMSFTHTSFGIEVVGVNQIKVFFGTNSLAKTYKRYVFRLAENQLPVVVPNMAGKWKLFAFDNQNLEQSFPIEFRAAAKTDSGLYRFNSIDDEWILDCWVNLDGVGNCDLSNDGLGLTMTYDLLDFNGNYAKAPLTVSNSLAAQAGILLRDGFHLPVLDGQ